jgi:hypothetical protein
VVDSNEERSCGRGDKFQKMAGQLASLMLGVRKPWPALEDLTNATTQRQAHPLGRHWELANLNP